MSNRARHEATTPQVCLRSGVPAIVTWSLIPLTFRLPLVDSTRAPYFDLTGTFSQLITRSGITVQRRLKEVSVVVLIAALNEYILKESLKIPRPNIVWLAGEAVRHIQIHRLFVAQ